MYEQSSVKIKIIMIDIMALQEDPDKVLTLAEKWDLDSKMLDEDNSGIRTAPEGLNKDQKDDFWMEIRNLDNEEELLDSSLTEEKINNMEYIQNIYSKEKEVILEKEKAIFAKYEKLVKQNKI